MEDAGSGGGIGDGGIGGSGPGEGGNGSGEGGTGSGEGGSGGTGPGAGGNGDGTGDGSGRGWGVGFGRGSGEGSGPGEGSGDGPGQGSGDGSGEGSGEGEGEGEGSGEGAGDGSGEGDGSGLGAGSGDGGSTGSGGGGSVSWPGRGAGANRVAGAPAAAPADWADDCGAADCGVCGMIGHGGSAGDWGTDEVGSGDGPRAPAAPRMKASAPRWSRSAADPVDWVGTSGGSRPVAVGLALALGVSLPGRGGVSPRVSPAGRGASHDWANAAQIASGSAGPGRRVGNPARVSDVSWPAGSGRTPIIVVGSSGATGVRVGRAPPPDRRPESSTPQDAHRCAVASTADPQTLHRASLPLSMCASRSWPVLSGTPDDCCASRCHVGHWDYRSRGRQKLWCRL